MDAAPLPGAKVESLNERRREATPAEADELQTLIALILPDADASERADVLRVALANVEAALTSFRALVTDLTPPPDGWD